MAKEASPSAAPVSQFGMWVAFLYVILFITLYVSATSLGGILHYAVDQFFKDNLDKVDYFRSIGKVLLTGYQAGLIVAFPIFASLFLFLKNQSIKNPQVKLLRTRKILIYLTLIGAFIIMIVHLIANLIFFLNGSTTIRSLGHLGVTFVIAGSIFIYPISSDL